MERGRRCYAVGVFDNPRSQVIEKLGLLRPVRRPPHWTPEFRGALRSAVLGRLWPQCRCHAAGFTDHNLCCLCLAAAVATHGVNSLDELPREALYAVPVGSLLHRVCSCPAHRRERELWAPDAVKWSQPSQNDVAAFTRALVPSIDYVVPPPAAEETFSWIARPAGGTVRARFYTDVSRLDGPSALLARNGWAFVAVDERGDVVASAHGVPPAWIVDIPGAEAWTLL